MLFRLVPIIIFIAFQFNAIRAVSQDNSNFSHYFMNPYSINPSFAGTDGRPSLFLTYRLQWADIEGAPKVSSASFHTPIGNKMGMGINVTNAQRGPLNTTSAYLSNSVGVNMSEKFIVRFGASFGAATNTVDIDALANADPTIFGSIDPLAENNLFLVGNVGLSLQAKYFNLGVSIPNIFSRDYVTTETSFTQGEVSPTENILLFASNRFYFQRKKKHMFEPFLLYRHSDVLPPQLEASGILTLNHTVWFGGSYRQDFGITALLGFKFDKSFGLGYAYSLSNSGENEINSPTHEIQLNLLLGNRKQDRFVYSFVDSELPKPKSKRQLALEERRKQLEEQRRLEEEQRKIEEEQQAKEEEERIAREKAEAEAQAKAQEEAQERALAEARAKEAEEKALAEARQVEEQNRIETQQAEQNKQSDLEKQQRAEQQRIEQQKIQEEQARQEKLRIQEEQKRQEQAAAKAEQERLEQERIENQQNNTQIEVEKEPVVTKPPVIEKPKNPAENLVEKYTTENRVVVKRGGHLLELGKGEYVIVGVFTSYEHAEKYSDDLFFKGYQSKFGYITQEKYWYVYVYQGDNIEAARKKRDELRVKNTFSKAWVLTVE